MLPNPNLQLAQVPPSQTTLWGRGPSWGPLGISEFLAAETPGEAVGPGKLESDFQAKDCEGDKHRTHLRT